MLISSETINYYTMGNCISHFEEMHQKRLEAEREADLPRRRRGTSDLYIADHKDQNDREFVLGSVKQNGSLNLIRAQTKFVEDREIVIAAVKNNGLALEYAYKHKADREVVFEAVKSNGLALKFANETLKADPDIMLEACSRHPPCFSCSYHLSPCACHNRHLTDCPMMVASKALTADREFMLIVFKQCYRQYKLLEYASDALKADPEIVFEAVKNNGNNLQYASDALKADRKIVLEACKQTWKAVKYASQSLLRANDGEIMIMIDSELEESGNETSESFDRKFEKFQSKDSESEESVDGVLESFDRKFGSFESKDLKVDLKADRKIVLEAVKQDGLLLKLVPGFKAHRKIALAACKQNWEALHYVSDVLLMADELSFEPYLNQKYAHSPPRSFLPIYKYGQQLQRSRNEYTSISNTSSSSSYSYSNPVADARNFSEYQTRWNRCETAARQERAMNSGAFHTF